MTGDPIPTKEELAARSATFRWPPLTPDAATQSPPSPPGRGAAVFGGGEGSAPPPLLSLQSANAPVSPSAWSILEHVWLDLIAPPLPQRMAQLGWLPDTPDLYCHRCGATIGPHESTPDGCPVCSARRLPWSRLVRLGEYRPPLSHFIQEVKFTRWRRLGRELGQLLAASVAPAMEAAGRDPAHLLVVPVPTTFRRRMARGIDHTHILAAAAARSLHAPLRQPLRRRHRPSQLDIPPSQRAANVSGTFRLRSARSLARLAAVGPAATILVIDDVTTTGATLRATCTALAGAFRETSPPLRPYIWAAVAAWTPPAGTGRRTGQITPTDAERRDGPGAAWT